MRFVSIVETNAASLDISRGDLDAARRRLGNVLARLHEHPNGRTEGYAHSNLAMVHFLADRLDAALDEVNQAVSCFEAAQDGLARSSTLVIWAGILSARGQVDEAMRALASAEEAQTQHPTPIIDHGLTAVRQMMALDQDPSDSVVSDTRTVIDALGRSGAAGLYYSRLLRHALQRHLGG